MAPVKTRDLAGLGGLVIALLVGACARLAGIGEGVDDALAPGTNPTGSTEQRTDANIAITPTSIDFGDVPCATDATAKLITIQNKGTSAATYAVQLPDGTSFRLDGPPKGVVPPKGAVTLSLFVNPHTARDNSVDLFVTAGDAVQPIHAKANGVGSTFELVQSTVDFGEVRKENGGGAVDVQVKNTGTEAAVVSGFTDFAPAYDVQWAGKPTALTVDAGGTAKFSVALLAAPTDDGAVVQAMIKPVAAKAFCGAAPVLLATGRRVTSDVTISPADWGKQDCNSQPGSKDVVITNYANASVLYNATLPATSAFTIANAGPGSVTAAASPAAPTTATIKVVPKALGATLVEIKETMAVALTSSAQGVTGTRAVPLHVDIRGAIITINPQSITTFQSNGRTTDTKTFTVTNSGNETIYLGWTFVRTAGGPAWTYSPPVMIPGDNTPLPGSIGFKPSTAGTNTATLTPSELAGARSCTPLQAIALSGTVR